MENPIKFEELIDVNDEFVRLTAQVVQLNDALKDIKTSASGLKESLSGLSGANGASGIGSAASEADRLAKAQKELTFALSETGRQLADIKKKTTDANGESKLMSDFINSSSESYKQLNAQLKLLTDSYKSKSKEQRETSEEAKKEVQDILGLKKQLKDLDAQMKLATNTNKEKIQAQKEEKVKLTELQIAQEKLSKARSLDAVEIAKVRLQTNEAVSISKLNAIIATSTEGSYERLSAQYALNKIALNKKSEAEIASSQSLTKLRDDTNLMYTQMSAMQEKTGKHTLSVGNYKKAWDGLGNSASQLTRELPSLAMSANMFFLAISNNIPIMADEINRLRIRNAELNAEGIKTPAVWQTVLKSFMSFNTVMMVGVALLTIYGGKIVTWIGNLFGAEKAVGSLSNRLKELSKSIENNSGEYTKNMLLFATLRKEWQGLGDDLEAQEAFIYKYGESFKNLNADIKDSNDAENLFVKGADAFVFSMQSRARAIAAVSLAQEEYKKQIKALSDDEERKNKVEKEGIGWWRGQIMEINALFKDEGTYQSFKRNYREETEAYVNEFSRKATEAEKQAKRYIDMSKTLNDIADKNRLKSGVKELPTKEQEEYNNKLEDLQKTANEARIASISNTYQREREEILSSYKQKEEDLKKDSEIYKKNKAQIDAIIIDYEKAKNRELSDLSKEYSDKKLKEQEDELKRVKKFQEDRKKVIEDAEKDIALTSDNEYQLKRDKLTKQYELDVQDAEAKQELYKEDADMFNLQAQRIVALSTKYSNDIKNIDDDEYKNKQANIKKIGDEKIRAFDLEAGYAEDLFNLEEHTENEKTKMKLDAEKKRIQMLLDLNKSGELELSAQQIEIYKKTIDKLATESKNVEKKFEKKDIYEIMGIKLKDEEKDVLNQSISYATGAIKDLANSYIESAQAAVRASQDRVSSAEKALDREKEAKANGYAYNTELAEKELAAAKKQQDKALKQEEKAKKASILIDSALQASSLITATANLWKAFSPLGLIGIALAVSSTALMWGSFAAAKAKALSVTKSSTAAKNYGEGGIEFLEGGSHASGNDIPIGTTKDGRRRNAEGGEAMIIINKKRTAKYKHQLPDIVNALNKGIFEQKYMSAFSGNVNVNSSVDLSNVEKGINTLTKQGERRIYTDSKGRIVEQYKNLRRVIA